MIKTKFLGGPLDGLEATWNRQPPWLVFFETPGGVGPGDFFYTPEKQNEKFVFVVTEDDEYPTERYELVGRGWNDESIEWNYWHESRNDAIPFYPDESPSEDTPDESLSEDT